MGTRIEGKVSRQFQASAERVYDAWLDPAQVRQWMAAALRSFGLTGDMQRIEIDPRVGGGFVFSDLRNGDEALHRGTYLTLDRPRTIAFTWIVGHDKVENPSNVTLTFQPEGSGCIVTLIHEMDAKWAAYVARTEAGWSRMLEQIGILLGS